LVFCAYILTVCMTTWSWAYIRWASGLALKPGVTYFIICLCVTEKSTLKWWVTEKATLTCYWKGYLDGWRITEKAILTCHWKCYNNVSLKRLWWRVTGHWKDYYDVNWNGYPDKSLKRLPWCVTKNAMMIGDGSLKRLLCLMWTEKVILTWTKKAMMTGKGSLKMLLCLTWTEKSTLTWTEKSSFIELYMKLLPDSGGYKST
jgi:hypothetical protein